MQVPISTAKTEVDSGAEGVAITVPAGEELDLTDRGIKSLLMSDSSVQIVLEGTE